MQEASGCAGAACYCAGCVCVSAWAPVLENADTAGSQKRQTRGKKLWEALRGVLSADCPSRQPLHAARSQGCTQAASGAGHGRAEACRQAARSGTIPAFLGCTERPQRSGEACATAEGVIWVSGTDPACCGTEPSLVCCLASVPVPCARQAIAVGSKCAGAVLEKRATD